MLKIIIGAVILAVVYVASASAQDTKKSWYQKGYDGPRITSLKHALAFQKEYMGGDNIGFRMPGSKDVCTALKAVKLACDYNTRGTLSMFLTVNGKGLFPAAGGTNPYFPTYDNTTFPDDGFIGRPIQNKMLAEAVKKNAKLFKDGDLTAEVVQKFWK